MATQKKLIVDEKDMSLYATPEVVEKKFKGATRKSKKKLKPQVGKSWPDGLEVESLRSTGKSEPKVFLIVGMAFGFGLMLMLLTWFNANDKSVTEKVIDFVIQALSWILFWALGRRG